MERKGRTVTVKRRKNGKEIEKHDGVIFAEDNIVRMSAGKGFMSVIYDADVKFEDEASDTKTTSPKAVSTFVNNKIGSVYRPQGSISFANLMAITPSSANLGFVYDVTDAFTTTDAFKEGAGVAVPANSNVAIIQVGSDYLFDLLGGVIDLSGYWAKTDLEEMSERDVLDAIDAA
jgi:hypothetical protein